MNAGAEKLIQVYRGGQETNLLKRKRMYPIKRIEKLIIMLMVSFLLGSTLTGCTNTADETGQTNSKVATIKNKTAEKAGIPVQYFFINGSLLGSYDREGWKSLCKPVIDDQAGENGQAFWAKDLLAQDAYYVYDGKNKKLLGVAKQIIWSTGTGGLGSFEDSSAEQKLAAYGELYNPVEGDISRPRIFKLPVKAGQDLDLKIPDYSFFTEFVIDSQAQSEYKLVTNRESNLFPRETADGLEATEAGERALARLFRREKMENTLPNFSDCIESDFDNDGKPEYLIFANNPKSEMGYPLLCSNGKTDHLGIFSALFYQDDDGSIQTLYSDLRPYNGVFQPDENNNMELMGPDYFTCINLLTIADLNDDGVYEIVVKKSGWEYGFYLAYAMNAKGKYELVMRSNYGM